jgi:DNA-binding MarR family transcriptional regulator
VPIVRDVAAPERAEALLDEIGELYAIVLRIARRIHAGDEPMTVTQRLALIEIAHAGPLRLRNLAQRMDTTPATATRAVDALEEWGFVRRRPEPADRRGVLVVVTPRGRRWADRRRALLREAIDALADAKVPDRLIRDMAQLNAALREVSGHDDVSRSALLAP